MKSIIPIILFSLIFFFSCEKQEQPTREELIDLELSSRIEKFTVKRQNRCEDELLEEVEYEVDSMMYYLVSKMTGQDSKAPDRPNRPGRLVDTIQLEELDTIQQ